MCLNLTLKLRFRDDIYLINLKYSPITVHTAPTARSKPVPSLLFNKGITFNLNFKVKVTTRAQ